MDSRIKGLYAITEETFDTGLLVRQVAAALRGGAKIVQYRSKHGAAQLRNEQATALSRQVRAAGAVFIVNDSVELAAQVRADGVHLGKDDGAVEQARDRLGPSALIGVSCYDQFELARAAERAGASYAAFGSFFASKTKPDAVRAPLALLRHARARLRIPIVAIGGITAANCKPLIEAGADAVAVASGVFGAADIEAAAAAIANHFFRHEAAGLAAMNR